MMINTLLKPTSMAALIATGTISFLPNLLLFLLPQIQEQTKASSPSTSRWLIVGQAFGAGGLIGDVFLHTLPESIIENSNNQPEQVGIFIVLGFTFFFLVDLFVRSVNETHHHHHNRHNQNDDHRHPTATTTTKRSIILLNLVADSLHNYTDGLAIGASYCSTSSIAQMNHQSTKMSYMNTIRSILQSHSRGGMATISICLHEIPHELSDYCTLVRAGYSTRQAILIQFVTAIAAFAGTITAILLVSSQQQHDENHYYEQRLLWMTAGGFLYLAGTTIIPEVLNYEHVTKESNNMSSTITSRLYFRWIHFIAFCTGLCMMGFVDWFSGDDHHHHHHHHSHDDHELHNTGVRHQHHHEHSEL